jgi:hypothetical protein
MAAVGAEAAVAVTAVGAAAMAVAVAVAEAVAIAAAEMARRQRSQWQWQAEGMARGRWECGFMCTKYEYICVWVYPSGRHVKYTRWAWAGGTFFR